MFSVQWSRVALTRPAIIVFAAGIAWLVAGSAIHFQPWYSVLFSADALYIPDFFNDLIRHQDHLSDWRLPPAANFFPDMPLYAVAMLAGGKFFTAVIFCIFLQIVLFLDACRALAVTARLHSQSNFVGMVMVLLILCYWPYLHHFHNFPKTNDIYWLLPLMVVGCHFGAILASLWALTLIGAALQCKRREGIARGAGLAGLIIATGCSDMLYLIWFCVPAFFCLLCCLGFAKQRLRIALLALTILQTSGLVYYVQSRFNPTFGSFNSGNARSWDDVRRSFDLLWAFLFGSGRGNALHAAVFIGAGTLLAAYGLVRLAITFWRGDVEPSALVRTLIVGFLAASPVACLGSGLYAGVFRDLAVTRYTLPLVFMVLLGLGFVFAEAVDRVEVPVPVWGRRGLLAGLVPLTFLFFLARAYGGPFPSPIGYDCLPKDHPLAGLAEYWQARQLEFFSGGRVQVAPLTGDGLPNWWISNRFWLTHSRDQLDAVPLYSFIDMRRLDPSLVEQLYGKPSNVVSCPGGDIWLYDDAEKLTAHFLELYRTHEAGA